MAAKEIMILKTALLNEVEGEAFYRLAASQTEETELASVFMHLADEEKQHQEWLRELISQIQKDQGFKISAWNEQGQTIKSPGIFKLDKLAEVPRSGLEMSVFHIGIMMEKTSMDYYREAATHTNIPEAHQLFEMLAGWERNHLDTLEASYDTLKEEWWEHQGFSPA